MKKRYWVLLFIFLLGCSLRLLGIVKAGGMWFDELLTWNISRQAFPLGILHKIIAEDFHFPLYYFMLHFWMKIFGSGDLVIRFLSYLFGVLTIPAAYLAGKEMLDRRTGFIAALLISVNSFSIYYSQEVRFYSLLGFLGFLSIFYLLKFIKNPNKKNSILLTLVNLAILYTNTVAFLFVFAEISIFLLYFYLNKKELLKKFIKLQLISIVAFIPGFLMLIHANEAIKHSFIKPFTWWGPFDHLTIISTMQNWFSPIFFDGYNSSTGYYDYLINHTQSTLPMIFLITVPVLIYLTIFAIFLRKDNFKTEKSYVFSVGVMLFLILIALCLMDKFRLIPRYTTLCLPPMILAASCYLSTLKNSKAINFFLVFLVYLNVVCFLIPPLSTPAMTRTGIMYATSQLKKYGITSADVLFMGEGGEFLPRYLGISPKAVIPFMEFHAYARGDVNQLKVVMNNKLIKSLNMETSRRTLEPYLSSNVPSPTLTRYINNKIEKLKSGRYFIEIAPKWTFDDYGKFRAIVKDPSIYNDEHISLCYFLMIKTYNDVADIAKYNINMKEIARINNHYWSILVLQKK